MTETQKRIRAYQKALPELRERVIAVALLLAMSTSMLSSASFAWLTLSRSPEVTAVSTTIAANGSLEVALATGNGKVAPGESKVGDSTAAKGQSVTGANITWGNLINLSDESYGLEHMVMRPAQLNRLDLLGSPLYGAAYSGDGRITKLESDFGYTAWVVDEEVGGRFMTTDQMGVRAISSMKADSSAAENVVAKQFKAVQEANLKAATTYMGLANDSGAMQSLATMMGLYMTARLNSSDADLSNPDCKVEDIRNLLNMYSGFLEAFDDEVQAMVQLANITLSLKYGEGYYQPVTAAKILDTATTSATLKKEGIQISDLTQFQKDRNTIASDIVKLNQICETTAASVKWKDSGLNNVVNNLVNVGECTIGEPPQKISSIGATDAFGYLSGTHDAKITNGILYRFEERTGGYLEVRNLAITATIKRELLGRPIKQDGKVTANVKTTASRDYNLFNNDFSYAKTQVEGGNFAVDMVAQDTYGLAVDLWVRTNAENSYLTLEGNVLTRTETIRATGKNTDNETVELFTLKRTVTDENGKSETYSMDVYAGLVDVTNPETGEVTQEDGYIYLDSHTAATVEEGDEIQPKMEEVVTVIGYEGENRIWNSDEYNNMLSTDATTQGSGSCYVYYADTPEDQARSLKLLEAFNVAFVDSNGKMLASAIMDTGNAYAAVGRVTVPLVMNPSESITLSQDASGNAEHAITMLERNIPTRITAIVYLDGTKLTNQDVLAAADIQGQLNIQFGTTTPMVPMEDDKLFDETVSVSATVSPTEFSWDEADGPLTATVTVTVTGYEPKSVTGFFMRQLSATQGTREEAMTFTKQSDGTWKGTHTFSAPGNYVLRTVRLDGIDYDVGQEVIILDEFGNPVLDDNGNTQTKVEYPGSTVSGFTVTSLSCVQANENRVINVMDAASEYPVTLNLSFASNDTEKMPKTVQGRFLDESGANVNVDFTYNPGSGWTGKGTFRISGDYTMKHLVMDGEPMPLEERFWLTASIALGMRASVYTSDNIRFTYLPGSVLEDGTTLWDDVYGELDMSVKIFDGGGKEKPGLHDVSLTYSSGSRTMYTPLEWNGTYYVGKMDNGGPGIWKFSNVKIGKEDGKTKVNTITQAITSPQFTIISPEPPRYVGYDTASYQFALGANQNLKMNVRLSYASTADNAVATIVNQKTGASYEVAFTNRVSAGVDGQESSYQFVVPADTNGYQDGTWKLTKIELWGGVYDSSAKEYNNDYRWTYDLSKENNVTKIVNKVTPVFTADASQDFGKDASGNVTGTFMQKHTLAAGSIAVVIADADGQPLEGLSDVKLQFAYKNKSCETYGGYSSSSLTTATAGANIVVNMAKDADNPTRYTQLDALEFLYAGYYETTFSFSVVTPDGKIIPVSYTTGSLPAKTPQFTVSSVSPSVAITARTSYGDSDSHTDTNATVNFGTSSGTCGVTNYKQPNVTITLSGYGNASKATLTFAKSDGGTVHLYTSSGGSTAVSTYEWTANGTCQRHVGKWQSKTGGDSKTAAGTLTATKLIMTYSGMSFEVDIPDITINNPS